MRTMFKGEHKSADTQFLALAPNFRLDFHNSVSIKRALCRCVSVPAPGLGIIEPCLPSPAKARPSGPGWLHEIKHDGFRILAHRDSAGVRLITRAGNDFSGRFPFIAMAIGKLPFRSGRRHNARRWRARRAGGSSQTPQARSRRTAAYH
jgi:hypothetical protein